MTTYNWNQWPTIGIEYGAIQTFRVCPPLDSCGGFPFCRVIMRTKGTARSTVPINTRGDERMRFQMPEIGHEPWATGLAVDSGS